MTTPSPQSDTYWRRVAEEKSRLKISMNNSEAKETKENLDRLIRQHTAGAVAAIDISSWLGWGEGIPVLDCIICNEKTEGRITFVINGQTAMHKDCMVGTLIDAPVETFEEICNRLEQGEALFGEDDE